MPSAPKLQAPQGQPLFDVQFRAISESLAGNGVLSNSDLEVTSGDAAMEIDVASGTVYYVASEHTFDGESPAATLSDGDADHDRWDTVAFDTDDSSITVHEGDPDSYPTPPDIEGDELLLAIVYVEAEATDIDNSAILNWRAKFSNEAEEVHYNDETDEYDVDNVEDALDELQEAAQISEYPLDIATDTEASAYPLANEDIENSSVDVEAGDGVTTSSTTINLGDSATIAVDEDYGPTWTALHTFEKPLELQEQGSTPSDPSSGNAKAYPKDDGFLYSLDEDGRERRVGGDVKTTDVTSDTTTDYEDIVFVDPSGTDGVTITLASDDARDGHGIMVIDTGSAAEDNPITLDTEGNEQIDGADTREIADNNAQLLLESDGSDWYTAGGNAAVGVNTDVFNADESGTVNDGNSGIVYAHGLKDGDTLEVLRAGLLLADGQAAPSDLDLVLATLDGSGGATKEETIIEGDGDVQATVEGDPLASYENTSGDDETVAILVDNGNFNSGTGSDEDIVVNAAGEVV